MRISTLRCRTLQKAGGRAMLLMMLLALVLPTVALAAAGALDPTFSKDGKVVTNVHPTRTDWLYDLAIQSDGKIVAVGISHKTGSRIISVVRYWPGGGLDKTFSGDGKQFTKLGDAYSEGDGVAIQPDGKIVVSGQSCDATGWTCDAGVVRYNTNGSLDTTFSGDGKATVDFGVGDNGSFGGLAIQPDGKIVIAGYMFNGHNYDMAVYRFDENGSLDTTFSGDGKAKVGFGKGRQDFARDLVLHPGGEISLAGFSCDATNKHCNFAVARFMSDGTLDKTFSGNGKLTTNFGAEETCYGAALQADGKLVVAGDRNNGSKDKIALARYNTDGSLDSTFSGDGKQVTAFIWAGAFDVLVDPSEKIVIAGWAGPDFGVVRYNSNGSLDSTFSGNGKLAVNFGKSETATAIALDGDGKYVVGGIKDIGSTEYFALARILP